MSSCQDSCYRQLLAITLGSPSNTTLWILFVSGVPPPLPPRLRIFLVKKGVTDLGGTPAPLPFRDISPKKILQKGLKIVFLLNK